MLSSVAAHPCVAPPRVMQATPAAGPGKLLCFRILEQCVHIVCTNRRLRDILIANYGALRVAPDGRIADLRYSITASRTPRALVIVRDGQGPLIAEDPSELLFLLEKDLTVELQKRRADLFFLHSAAVEWQGKACLLVAESGTGKSTTTWALLHRGFRYLSDELSPVDVNSMEVLPYAHALCLKQRPPTNYPLPSDALDLGLTLHVPVSALPSAVVMGPTPVATVVFLSRGAAGAAPVLRAVGRSEAAARLYATALNALAHPDHGLDAAVKIASHVPCFVLVSGELGATCTKLSVALTTRCDGSSKQEHKHELASLK